MFSNELGFLLRLLGRMRAVNPSSYGRHDPEPSFSLRVQVPNNHILTENLYYTYYYPNSKYLVIGHMDPFGFTFEEILASCRSKASSPNPLP